MRINRDKFMEHYADVIAKKDEEKIAITEAIINRLYEMEDKQGRIFPDVELSVNEFKILYKEKF